MTGWFAKLLVAIGLLAPLPAPAEEVAPNVDATAVLGVLRAKSDADALIAGFSDLYQQVITLDRSGPEGLAKGMIDPLYFSVVLDLWNNQQPYATLACSRFGSGSLAMLDTVFAGEPLAEIIQQPLAAGMHQRMICGFDYWDPAEKVDAFVVQAKLWGEEAIGSFSGDPAVPEGATLLADGLAMGGHKSFAITRVAAGMESQVRLMLVIDR